MMQITGCKSASSLDRYDDTLEVSREVAMRALEAPIFDGAPQVDIQYSTLKKQVTSEYIEHHDVKVPSVSRILGSVTSALNVLALATSRGDKCTEVSTHGTTNLAILDLDSDPDTFMCPSVPIGYIDRSSCGPSGSFSNLGPSLIAEAFYENVVGPILASQLESRIQN
jgi:hypothetical protein